ncbi:MAG: ATP-binding protein [Bacteroidales bacterium]|nr:ATP-binding protein [Bacteroidales bacterium]
MNKKPENPFFTTISIPDEYFCDRKKETLDLINGLKNGYNIVLKSPRRIGKSSLIKHVFLQPEIAGQYNTLYIDIYGTKCAADFIREFQNGFLSASFAKFERGRKSVLSMLRNLYFEVQTTPGGELSGARIGFDGETRISFTLQEMFNFLEQTNKPNIVVFDEFQQIQYYPERMSAILRSFVQQMNNTHFIFSGSSRHLLSQMFDMPNEPFYKSAKSMDLNIISIESYREFCRSMFRLYGKEIEDTAIDLVYHLFCGNTYDMQQVMKAAFAGAVKTRAVDVDAIIATIQLILFDKDKDFRENLNRLDNQKERRVLFCIANEGLATGLTSASTMKRYGLDNASSVQNALRNLCGDKLNMVAKVGRSHYKLQDKFFELWLAKMNHTFDAKVANAGVLFEAVREIEG